MTEPLSECPCSGPCSWASISSLVHDGWTQLRRIWRVIRVLALHACWTLLGCPVGARRGDREGEDALACRPRNAVGCARIVRARPVNTGAVQGPNAIFRASEARLGRNCRCWWTSVGSSSRLDTTLDSSDERRYLPPPVDGHPGPGRKHRAVAQWESATLTRWKSAVRNRPALPGMAGRAVVQWSIADDLVGVPAKCGGKIAWTAPACAAQVGRRRST